MVYSNDSGDANLSGPVTIDRSGDKPLTGETGNLIYNVDSEEVKLTGKVKLVQDGRTTTASSAIVIEKEGFAYLYGSEKEPVRSEKGGKEKIQGTSVIYNLDNGDVKVIGKVSGEVEEE
jgi:lipopolysaccharide export system protein LptA